MKILERELGALTYQANQQATLMLPRNYAYRILSLKLLANVSVNQTTAGVVMDSCPAQLVRNIIVRANGRDVIKNYDMETLHRLTQIRMATRPRIVSLANTTTTNTVDLECHALIHFEMWRSVKPIDSLLDSSGLATLELIVTWGAMNDIMGGAFGGTVTVHAAHLYISSIEAIGVPAGTKFMVNKEYAIDSTIAAASARHQVNLPVGNLYRSFVFKTVSDDILVNTIFNGSITLKSGTEVFKERDNYHLQMDNKVEYSLEIPVSTIILENLLVGYYIFEFVKDGRLTECLDTSRLSTLELLCSVANPGAADHLYIYPVELIVPPVEA